MSLLRDKSYCVYSAWKHSALPPTLMTELEVSGGLFLSGCLLTSPFYHHLLPLSPWAPASRLPAGSSGCLCCGLGQRASYMVLLVSLRVTNFFLPYWLSCFYAMAFRKKQCWLHYSEPVSTLAKTQRRVCYWELCYFVQETFTYSFQLDSTGFYVAMSKIILSPTV